jgi:hypothetical protein
LAREFSAPLDDEGRRLLNKVMRSGTEMSEKIDGLFYFTLPDHP